MFGLVEFLTAGQSFDQVSRLRYHPRCSIHPGFHRLVDLVQVVIGFKPSTTWDGILEFSVDPQFDSLDEVYVDPEG